MINFPIKKAPSLVKNEKNIKKANLGMLLEEMINDTNTYYLNKGVAVIHKKPVPIQIVKVNYPSRCEAIIQLLIIRLLLQLTIMESTEESILTLKLKKQIILLPLA